MTEETRNYLYFLVRSVDTVSAITIFASSILWKYLRKSLLNFWHLSDIDEVTMIDVEFLIYSI